MTPKDTGKRVCTVEKPLHFFLVVVRPYLRAFFFVRRPTPSVFCAV